MQAHARCAVRNTPLLLELSHCAAERLGGSVARTPHTFMKRVKSRPTTVCRSAPLGPPWPHRPQPLHSCPPMPGGQLKTGCCRSGSRIERQQPPEPAVRRPRRCTARPPGASCRQAILVRDPDRNVHRDASARLIEPAAICSACRRCAACCAVPHLRPRGNPVLL